MTRDVPVSTRKLAKILKCDCFTRATAYRCRNLNMLFKCPYLLTFSINTSCRLSSERLKNSRNRLVGKNTELRRACL